MRTWKSDTGGLWYRCVIGIVVRLTGLTISTLSRAFCFDGRTADGRGLLLSGSAGLVSISVREMDRSAAAFTSHVGLVRDAKLYRLRVADIRPVAI